MNNRLWELEKQATETVKCGLNGTETTQRFNRKKFAELIVKECAAMAKGFEFVVQREGLSEAMKQHFGVKE